MKEKYFKIGRPEIIGMVVSEFVYERYNTLIDDIVDKSDFFFDGFAKNGPTSTDEMEIVHQVNNPYMYDLIHLFVPTDEPLEYKLFAIFEVHKNVVDGKVSLVKNEATKEMRDYIMKEEKKYLNTAGMFL